MTASRPMLLRAYGAVAHFPGPLAARWFLRRRAQRGKEDPDRLEERFGRSNRARPEGPLVWLHAASVGEAASLHPLIFAFAERRPDIHVLLTTGTVTAAQMIAPRLPATAFHQFAPIDTAPAIRSFLDHWRPDFLGVAESELWPTMLEETAGRGTPIALLSARISQESAQGWRRAPKVIAHLLSRFSLILAQTSQISSRFADLGAAPERLYVCGALKDAAAPLPVDLAALEKMRGALSGRAFWLAASTHAGEEEAALEAHSQVCAQRGEGLLLLAPRHPNRAEEVAQFCAARGWRVERRSQSQTPSAQAQVYLIDVLGELGLWYRLAPLAFVGGSLLKIGGHNPLEAARLDCAVAHGPYVANFQSEYERLHALGGAIEVAGSEQMANALLALTRSDGALNETGAALTAAARGACLDGAAILDGVWSQIAPLLPKPAGE